MKKTINATVTTDEMKELIRQRNFCGSVRELRGEGLTLEEALEYVYDQLTLTNDEFRVKYNIW